MTDEVLLLCLVLAAVRVVPRDYVLPGALAAADRSEQLSALANEVLAGVRLQDAFVSPGSGRIEHRRSIVSGQPWLDHHPCHGKATYNPMASVALPWLSHRGCCPERQSNKRFLA